MNDEWYRIIDGESHGPLALSELIRELSTLPNWREIFVWRTGMDQWVQAGDVQELSPVASRMPRRPAPPQSSLRRKFRFSVVNVALSIVAAIIVAGALALLTVKLFS